MQIVKVRYQFHNSEELSSQEYTYLSEEPLNIGEMVMVPVKSSGTVKAQVTQVDVPEDEIAAFRDKVKVIPAGSRLVQQAEEHIEIPDVRSPKFEVDEDEVVANDLGPAQTTETDSGQAITMLTPQKNPDVLAQAERAMSLMLAAEKAVIDSDNAVKAATNDLSLIAGVKKELTAQRENYLRPLKDATARINEAFKMYMGPVTRADELLRGKILGHRKQQEADRQERERINALKMEAAQAEMKVNGELSEPVDLIEETPAPAQRYRADIGMASTMKVRKWRLIDISKVPDEYKVVDGPKVTKLVKAGIGSIPGIEIYEEDTLQVRST